jgi:acyl carrier protein
MELQQFIEKFSEQFDETESSEFKPDTIYKDLEEWSSLNALSIIAMVDEEYSVVIKGEDIQNAETIEDLFMTVSEKHKQNG